MPEYKTIEAKVKRVEAFSSRRFFDALKLSGCLEIELEQNDSPVQYIVMDRVFPVEKGDYLKIKIDVFYGYTNKPLQVRCRDLESAEKAAVVEKINPDGEVVATYHGEHT